MTECTRCGTPTSNDAVGSYPERGRSFLHEWNGVVWLCDGCQAEFVSWIEAGADGQFLTSIEGDVLSTQIQGGKILARVEYDVPKLLSDAFGWGEIEQTLRESSFEWTISVVEGDEDDG